MSGTFQVVVFVLDTTIGKPAVGVSVEVARQDTRGRWITILKDKTNAAGSLEALSRSPGAQKSGDYRIVYKMEAYFAKRGFKCFFPEVVVSLRLHREERYVLPLLVGPYSYTTYRGS